MRLSRWGQSTFRDWTRFGSMVSVIAFTFAIAFLTSLIFGLIPALQASRPQVEQSLREASRGSTSGVRSHRLRFAFVVSQFALSLVLLVGAGLLIRSFAELRSVQPGFEARGVVTFWQALPKARYSEVDQQTQFFDKLLAKLTSLAGNRRSRDGFAAAV